MIKMKKNPLSKFEKNTGQKSGVGFIRLALYWQKVGT
jgi:hypothetical protein